MMVGMKAGKQFSDEIRAAIDGAGESRYAISKATGIGQSALSKFMNRNGDLSMAVLDRLAKHLGLHVTTKRKGR
jgi:transcriptional regulator with XRE-family HTH domain